MQGQASRVHTAPNWYWEHAAMAVCWGGSTVQHTATAVCSSTQHTDKQGAHPTSRSSTQPFDKVYLTMSIGASSFCAQQCIILFAAMLECMALKHVFWMKKRGEGGVGRGGVRGEEEEKRERRWRWRNR